MITAGATPTPKTIDQRRVALTSPQVKTLQTDNAGTLYRPLVIDGVGDGDDEILVGVGTPRRPSCWSVGAVLAAVPGGYDAGVGIRRPDQTCLRVLLTRGSHRHGHAHLRRTRTRTPRPTVRATSKPSSQTLKS